MQVTQLLIFIHSPGGAFSVISCQRAVICDLQSDHWKCSRSWLETILQTVYVSFFNHARFHRGVTRANFGVSSNIVFTCPVQTQFHHKVCMQAWHYHYTCDCQMINNKKWQQWLWLLSAILRSTKVSYVVYYCFSFIRLIIENFHSISHCHKCNVKCLFTENSNIIIRS